MVTTVTGRLTQLLINFYSVIWSINKKEILTVVWLIMCSLAACQSLHCTFTLLPKMVLWKEKCYF